MCLPTKFFSGFSFVGWLVSKHTQWLVSKHTQCLRASQTQMQPCSSCWKQNAHKNSLTDFGSGETAYKRHVCYDFATKQSGADPVDFAQVFLSGCLVQRSPQEMDRLTVLHNKLNYDLLFISNRAIAEAVNFMFYINSFVYKLVYRHHLHTDYIQKNFRSIFLSISISPVPPIVLCTSISPM